MSETKHTAHAPGRPDLPLTDLRVNWSVYGGPYICLSSHLDGGVSHSVVKVFVTDTEPFETKRARVNLFLAAPDMLAVLREAADWIKDTDSGNPETETGWDSDELLDLWLRARAAIAKATGESQ